ncbi:MAG: hypothetical protein WA406_12210, partial [Pseudolabrys sp.]
GPIPKSVPLPDWLQGDVNLGFRYFPSYRAFLIVVAVGGLGSLKGTLLAALVLGVFDTAGKYLLADAGGFFVYAVTVVVLLIKPAGFYGRE